jgi:hypothetical protein
LDSVGSGTALLSVGEREARQPSAISIQRDLHGDIEFAVPLDRSGSAARVVTVAPRNPVIDGFSTTINLLRSCVSGISSRELSMSKTVPGERATFSSTLRSGTLMRSTPVCLTSIWEKSRLSEVEGLSFGTTTSSVALTPILGSATVCRVCPGLSDGLPGGRVLRCQCFLRLLRPSGHLLRCPTLFDVEFQLMAIRLDQHFVAGLRFSAQHHA